VQRFCSDTRFPPDVSDERIYYRYRVGFARESIAAKMNRYKDRKGAGTDPQCQGRPVFVMASGKGEREL
jgi:hypothetical protein